MCSFIEKCLSGQALLDEVDFYIDQWHNGNSDVPLHTYLGTGLSYRNGQVAVSLTFVVATLQNHDYRSLPAQNYHFLSTS